MQTTTSTASRRTLTIVRRPIRRPFGSYGATARASGVLAPERETPTSTSLRASLAEAFQALGAGVGAATAQEHVNAFYRASRQAWARSLGTITHGSRQTLAAAFRALGASVAQDVAHERTVAFYRASGHAWAANVA